MCYLDLYDILNSNTPPTDEQLHKVIDHSSESKANLSHEQFQQLADEFIESYNKKATGIPGRAGYSPSLFENAKPTPYMHALQSHGKDQMQRLRTFGLTWNMLSAQVRIFLILFI